MSTISYSIFQPTHIETILSEKERKEITHKYSGDSCHVRFDNFPPIMSDGRIFLSTSVPTIPETILPNIQTSSHFHGTTIDVPGLMTEKRQPDNWEYRQFMTTHANKLRQEWFMEYTKDIIAKN
jgi:hypothetical protein